MKAEIKTFMPKGIYMLYGQRAIHFFQLFNTIIPNQFYIFFT